MENEPVKTVLGGHAAFLYTQTDSTNTRLKRLAMFGAAHGTLAVAETQTAGRGRFDRKWLSRPGMGAWFSMLVRPDENELSAEKTPGLVFVAALAMAEALNAAAPDSVRVKWPNDLVIHGKKICGIMCEMNAANGFLSWAVVGIGVNLIGRDFPPELPWAGSFESETDVRLAPTDVISAFVKRFDDWYLTWKTHGLSPVLSALSGISATLSKRVRVTDADGRQTEGTALRFAENGALVVDVDGKERTFLAGDVSVRGMMDYV